MTQKEFAGALDVSPKTIQAVELGQLKISDSLKRSVSWFTGVCESVFDDGEVEIWSDIDGKTFTKEWFEEFLAENMKPMIGERFGFVENLIKLIALSSELLLEALRKGRFSTVEQRLSEQLVNEWKAIGLGEPEWKDLPRMGLFPSDIAEFSGQLVESYCQEFFRVYDKKAFANGGYGSDRTLRGVLKKDQFDALKKYPVIGPDGKVVKFAIGKDRYEELGIWDYRSLTDGRPEHRRHKQDPIYDFEEWQISTLTQENRPVTVLFVSVADYQQILAEKQKGDSESAIFREIASLWALNKNLFPDGFAFSTMSVLRDKAAIVARLYRHPKKNASLHVGTFTIMPNSTGKSGLGWKPVVKIWEPRRLKKLATSSSDR